MVLAIDTVLLSVLVSVYDMDILDYICKSALEAFVFKSKGKLTTLSIITLKSSISSKDSSGKVQYCLKCASIKFDSFKFV